MRETSPRPPSHLSPYALACFRALREAGLSDVVSIGGALGLFHYLEYRSTHDADAWWQEEAGSEQRQQVIHVIETALQQFGATRTRTWGDVVSIELLQQGKAVFSFQIASRDVRLRDSIWVQDEGIRLDSLPDLIAAKMNALIERGAPRDFLDIFTLCFHQLAEPEECWALWQERQTLSGEDSDFERARLAIETHLERIALHRPLESLSAEQRAQAETVRRWFREVFLASKHE